MLYSLQFKIGVHLLNGELSQLLTPIKNNLLQILFFSSETLRFRSPIGLLQRCVEKDYKIPGHDVVLRKDSSVWINAMSLHFDPKHYANPNVFDPEHFCKEARAKRNP